MPAFICTTCGTQFAPDEAPPAACPICEDERQFVNPAGQSWTTLEALAASHWNGFRRYEPGLYGFATFPSFGIGQRAFVVCAPGGNVLWDCITLVDDATIDLIRGIGGLKAIAISHPHYYTTMVEWSRAFGGIPVYLHEADRQWVMRSDPVVQFWHGDRRELGNGLTLIHGGGHFAGGTMLHWRRDNGKHVLLSGDILQVVPDRRHVSLMRSYPNLIPLSAAMARAVLQRLDGFDFNSVYGAFWGREILENGRAAVDASIARYVAELERGAEDR